MENISTFTSQALTDELLCEDHELEWMFPISGTEVSMDQRAKYKIRELRQSSHACMTEILVKS
jgi:hypothetical protein